jgi:hypothetical protein
VVLWDAGDALVVAAAHVAQHLPSGTSAL